MGTHIDTRQRKKQKRADFDKEARKQRASFKQYLRELDEELLEEEYKDDIFSDDLDDLNE